MPYETVADLPPAFSSLPQGAKSLAMRTMNAILSGKPETKALIIEAIRAAWGNIKSAYMRMANGIWVAKSALVTVAPEGLAEVHAVLKEEMERRGLPHDTPWLTEKLAASPTMGQVHIGRNVVGDTTTKFACVCPDCGAKANPDQGNSCADTACTECDAKMQDMPAVVQKTGWHQMLKADEDEHTVAGVVYAADDVAIAEWVAKGKPDVGKPDTIDTQGDHISEENLRASYNQFARLMDRMALSGDSRPFGVGHRVLNPNFTLLQNAVLCKGTRWPLPDSPPLTAALSWVQQLHVGDDGLWAQFKSGELGGFSLEGMAEK